MFIGSMSIFLFWGSPRARIREDAAGVIGAPDPPTQQVTNVSQPSGERVASASNRIMRAVKE